MSTHSSIFSFSRFSEFIALISLSTTLFLFIHTRDLTLQLDQERLRHEADLDTKEIVEDIVTVEQYEAKYGKVMFYKL